MKKTVRDDWGMKTLSTYTKKVFRSNMRTLQEKKKEHKPFMLSDWQI